MPEAPAFHYPFLFENDVVGGGEMGDLSRLFDEEGADQQLQYQLQQQRHQNELAQGEFFAAKQFGSNILYNSQLQQQMAQQQNDYLSSAVSQDSRDLTQQLYMLEQNTQQVLFSRTNGIPLTLNNKTTNALLNQCNFSAAGKEDIPLNFPHMAEDQFHRNATQLPFSLANLPFFGGHIDKPVLDASRSMTSSLEHTWQLQQLLNANMQQQLQIQQQALIAPAVSPLKALSAYNFFFRDERDRILNECEHDWTENKKEKLLSDHWNRDRTMKRRHRKSHGKIDFTTLSKLISSRWKELSEDRKDFYRDVAAKDWERYKKELSEYKTAVSDPSTAPFNAIG